eukprot:scaffold292018_cov32-Tisochrysis_lutea.AAC.2
MAGMRPRTKLIEEPKVAQKAEMSVPSITPPKSTGEMDGSTMPTGMNSPISVTCGRCARRPGVAVDDAPRAGWAVAVACRAGRSPFQCI